MSILHVCLDCKQLTPHGRRCPDCQARRDALYDNSFKRRSYRVRKNAEVCWICGEGERLGDPWTADHLAPGDPESVLLPAHRSCNSRRGDRPIVRT